MPKAREVYRALVRDGWVMVRRRGTSHRVMRKEGKRQAIWAFHDSRDLGNTEMAQIAGQFGYTLDELRTKL